MKEFVMDVFDRIVYQQFDKILMTFIIVVFTVMAFHGFHHGEKDFAQFAVDNSKLFSGALLTLITGKLLAGKNGNGNGSSPNGSGQSGH